MRSLLISPHNDDETLWAAFTILREQPTVVVALDSYIQVARGDLQCTAERRRAETIAAMQILNPGSAPQFLGLRDDEFSLFDLDEALRQFGQPEMVYAPAFEEGGH